MCPDADGDGACDTADCAPNDPAINPGVMEVCGNGQDDNCDGQVDEGCGACADGYRVPEGSLPASLGGVCSECGYGCSRTSPHRIAISERL